MNLPEIINKLNNEQSQAVTLDSAQNALILAGAGSGKILRLKSKELRMNGNQAMKMAKLIQKKTLRIFANH
jgi:hypothetical protein